MLEPNNNYLISGIEFINVFVTLIKISRKIPILKTIRIGRTPNWPYSIYLNRGCACVAHVDVGSSGSWHARTRLRQLLQSQERSWANSLLKFWASLNFYFFIGWQYDEPIMGNNSSERVIQSFHDPYSYNCRAFKTVRLMYVFNDRERTDCPKKTILGRQ